jgi:hypothetical protein
MGSPLELGGRWTYRSFMSKPDHVKSFDELKFGQGDFVIDPSPPGVFAGILNLETGASLTLKGTMTYGNPCMVSFRGTGVSPKAVGWIYDYVGFLVPHWLNGVDQRPAIIGTVIRTVEHDDQSAGYVACWIAVRQ